MIAVITMFIDHIGGVVILLYVNQLAHMVTTQEDLVQYQMWVKFYYFLRYIGRLSFPIFAFFIVEGFLHTHHMRKYIARLLAFAVVSEIPFDLAFSGGVSFEDQNTFFTLSIGLLCLCGIRWVEAYQEKYSIGWWLESIIVMAAGIFAGELLHSDYGGYGVAVICTFYFLRDIRFAGAAVTSAILCVLSKMEITAFFTVFLLDFYDGTRGRQSKYFFYIFYPAHFLVLYYVTIRLGLR